MSELDPPVLGVTDAGIDIDSSERLRDVALSMALQAERTIDILSRHLDPPIFDNDEFTEAVKQLALGSRRAKIRLLIINSQPLVRDGHRLVDLANRLSSFIEIRAPARQHRQFNEAWLVADNTAYIHRQFSDRFDAEANFADRRVSDSLSGRFEDIWERGVPDTRLRRLHL